MGNIIEIKDLSKTFNQDSNPVRALEDINLEIEEGSFLSIIGGSGCGKSTLTRIIGGLDTEYEGGYLLDGKKVTGPSRDKGFIFQDHRLLPWLTVRENIRFALSAENKKNEDIILKNIELVGLKGFEDAYPKELSGGMAQRVAVARALANKPRVLLLDEPFGALDALTKMKLQDEMIRIWKQENITMIIVTHDIDEAVFLGQKVVIMTPHPGRIKKIEHVNLGSRRSRTGEEFKEAKLRVYNDFFSIENPVFSYSI